ncbi:MAG TPA: hypothetical protein VMV69_15970 [Pirellulales bacterium]|nr:hypothetical protein [Pirellulales bacterium]
MATDSLFPYQWDQLPDPAATNAPNGPRTQIELLERDWRKIVGKHFTRSSEPWRDILPTSTFDLLKGSPYGALDFGPLREATENALSILGQEIAASLRRPRAIVYSRLQQRGSHWRPTRNWLLLLPCGALAVVRADPPSNLLKTCYFPGSVGVIPKEERWRIAIGRVVREQKYATFDKTTNDFVYPATQDLREVAILGQAPELPYHVTFVTAQSWGFIAPVAGSPWRLPSWHWVDPIAETEPESGQ